MNWLKDKWLSFFNDSDGYMLDGITYRILASYFFILASYPFVRSATSAIFYDYYTANDYSFATFLTIIALVLCVSLVNWAQKRFGINTAFNAVTIFSSLSLLMTLGLLHQGVKEAAFLLFSLKEIYVVLILHMIVAFANGYYSLGRIKKLYGILGAVGSVGGVIGGQLTSYVAKSQGTQSVIYWGVLLIVFTLISFRKTSVYNQRVEHATSEEEKISPLAAIKGKEKYIFYIAMLVALSQFSIYLADLNFNVSFADAFSSKDERSAYLGNLYSYINMVTLIIQIVFIRIILLKFSNQWILIFTPIFYLVLVAGSFLSGASALFLTSFMFISLKATDYSLFAVSKEVLYHPLTRLQKYGAKYITDVFVYRVAKGLIALILAAVTLESSMLFGLMSLGFILMPIFVVLLYKEIKEE